MNPFAALLTLLVGVNATFELRKHVRESNEHKRRKILDRMGRARPAVVARKLERLGGPHAQVRHGLDHDGDTALVVERWTKPDAPPTTFMGFPVLLGYRSQERGSS